MHLGKHLAAMLAANKRLAGVTPEVNLREHNTYTTTKSNKAAHSGFETQRRHHHKSKTGYQWDHQRTYVLQFFFKKVRIPRSSCTVYNTGRGDCWSLFTYIINGSQNPSLFLHRVQCRTWRLLITIHIHNKWKLESHALPPLCTMQDVETVDHYSHT